MVTDFIHLFDDAAKLKIPTFFKTILGAVRKLCHLGSGVGQPRTSSRKSVLPKSHFRNRIGYEFSKLASKIAYFTE